MEKSYENYLYNMDAQASCLLGSFVDDKTYVIEEPVSKELIVCNKIIDSYRQDLITAHAVVTGFKINFSVYIQMGEENKKRAGLFVDETAKLGIANEKIQTFLAAVVFENNGNFNEALKKAFHLYLPDESTGVDMSNSNLVAIINKLKGTKDLYATMMPYFIDADRDYVSKILSIIKRSGKYGEILLIELSKNIRDIKISKADSKYWREVKLLLDKMLLKNKDVFDSDIKNKIELVQKEYQKLAGTIKLPEQKSTVAKKGGAPKKDADGGSKPKAKAKGKTDQGKQPDKISMVNFSIKDVLNQNQPNFMRNKPKDKSDNFSFGDVFAQVRTGIQREGYLRPIKTKKRLKSDLQKEKKQKNKEQELQM